MASLASVRQICWYIFNKNIESILKVWQTILVHIFASQDPSHSFINCICVLLIFFEASSLFVPVFRLILPRYKFVMKNTRQDVHIAAF